MSGCASGAGSTLNGVGDLTVWQSPTQGCKRAPVLLINETKFTNYHRLGSTARIVSDASPVGAPAQEAPHLAAPDTAAEPAAGHPVNSVVEQPEQKQETQMAAAAPAASTGSSPAPAPEPAPEPFVPEISLTDTKAVPNTPANSGAAQDTGFSIKVTARLVDVGIVAFDKRAGRSRI
jgi:hypothetical protein